MAGLLLVPLAHATGQLAGGLAVGLDNARKAEKTSWSFTIGNKVFSTSQSRPFPFTELPFELREQIVLLGVEYSKSLLGGLDLPISLLPLTGRWPPPGHPFRDPEHPLYHHPQNPFTDRNLPRPRELNGHPVSTWRWQLVCTEWRAIVRPQLWRETTLQGKAAYKSFARMLAEQPELVTQIKALGFKEGFEEMYEVYQFMQKCRSIDRLSYGPRPRVNHLAPFGVNLIPNTPGPTELQINIPLDLITNPTTRAHLLTLPRLETLTLHIDKLDEALSIFFASLPHVRTLSLTVHAVTLLALAPFGHYRAPAESPLETLTFYLPSLLPDSLLRVRQLIERDERLARICTMFVGSGVDMQVVHAPDGQEESALSVATLKTPAPTRRDRPRDQSNGEPEHWERTTNLTMFGGLIGVKMESRR